MGHLNVIAESAAAAEAALRSLQGEGAPPAAAPRVGVIMGSDSDLGCMRAAAEVLEQFGFGLGLGLGFGLGLGLGSVLTLTLTLTLTRCSSSSAWRTS